MFVQRQIREAGIMIFATGIRLAEVEPVRDRNLRYYVCLQEFLKNADVAYIRYKEHAEALEEEEEILGDTQNTRPHPSIATGAASPAAGSASPVADPASPVAGSASPVASSASAVAGPSGTAEVVDSDSSSSDEESYAEIAADIKNHLKNLDSDSISTLMSGKDDKDLKKQYEQAAASAESKEGSKKWPEVKRMWKVTKDNGIVYAVVEFGTKIVDWWDPTLRASLTTINQNA
ncbi:hypothetical protein BLS_008163 [Venturia inaequalis]|uniref:Uncharacterized protein n=1 Tax=Venturia inaequalis TaxID=5025 RepID=A0A8H3V1Q5_VENIN|nr:hypothetical protein BLS_008163 [Venturia inaequalis]KAE9988502.1 hypothetical protein EG328_010541 [Venturia inaequalis]KAE9990750.1 hypothetical protein EG327_000983 [Venturia inaequalis]